MKIIKMLWFNKKPKQLPAASGPFLPGCSDIMIDYGKDGLFFRLYYPTITAKGTEHISKKWLNWIPSDGNLLRGMAKVIHIPLFLLNVVFWWNGIPLVPVLYGEKPKIEDNMKCVIFSHGLGGHRYLYSQTCCELASHGYLVACLEHRDKSSSHTYYYENKENVENDKKSYIDFMHIPTGENHLKIRKEQVKHRSIEIMKTIKFFKQVNSGAVPENILDNLLENKKFDFQLNSLIGKIDVDTFILMGHSFGAAAALATLPKSPSIKLAVALDPWMFPIKDDNLHEEVTSKPILFINTETFHIDVNVKGMAKFLSNKNAEMYTIRRTTHENQTDSVLVAGYWLNIFMKKIDPNIALNINNALMIRFLNKHANLPKNSDFYENYLEENSQYLETGLTKPWIVKSWDNIWSI